MTLNSLIKTAVLCLTLFTTHTAMAGGAGAAPRYDRFNMIHCHSVNPNEKLVRELNYLTVVEQGSPIEKGSTSLFLKGDLFNILINGGNDLLTVTAPTDQPVAFNPMNGIEAYLWNVRAIRILVNGNRLSLSMVAGALGQNRVTNLEMICSAAN
jgi:hypothetical protein